MSHHQKTQLHHLLNQHFDHAPTALYQLVAQNQSSTQADWRLLGTDGCHLCDEMDAFLQQQAVRFDLPPIVRLEILDFLSKDDKKIFEQLSHFIPILITPHDFLCYPFGVMDILTLNNYYKNQ